MRFLISLLDCIQGSKFLMTFFKVGPLRRSGFVKGAWKSRAKKANSTGTVWFHAASLGELEMVRPLIEDLLREGRAVGVSVFSESALSGLEDLRDRCVYAGLSPREGEWREVFDFFGVGKLILSKYDFWPGLMVAASRCSIPVLVINARPGKSLMWVRRIFAVFGASPPRFRFFCNPGVDCTDLGRWFPDSVFMDGIDPRWERVSRRIESARKGTSLKNDRVRFWIDQAKDLPGPKVLLGSAWMSDLEPLIPAFRTGAGTLIVVPHRLDDKTLRGMRTLLSQELPGRFLLVDEMGILVELYSGVDRAIVGGGFGHGIHSTLEPAASGLPVACGPGRVEDFPDARELRAGGVLTVCKNPDEFRIWLGNHSLPVLDAVRIEAQRTRYRTLLEDCR